MDHRDNQRGGLVDSSSRHEACLLRWLAVASDAQWNSPADVRSAFPKAKVLNGERIRFEVAGGDYRLVVAFDSGRQAAFIKFIGTHTDYDRVDALTVAEF